MVLAGGFESEAMNSPETGEERFVSLIFRGRRFDASMPVPALAELIAYQDIVVAVARGLFFAANPDRSRLPKGFESSFKLAMKGVEKGSAVPLIVRVDEAPKPPFHVVFDERDLFERARDLVEATIDAVANDRALPPELPVDVLPRFTAFGRTLDNDDSIIVAQPGKVSGATYDKRVRRLLVLRGQGTYEDEVNLVGEVRAADKDRDGFFIRLDDEQKLEVRTPRAFFPVALRSMTESASIRVRGTGLFDAEGTLLRVNMASDVSMAEEGDEQTRPGCPTPVDTQLESLKALAPGWYDGVGDSYEPTKLDWLAKLLVAVLDGFQLPRPYIDPTPEGIARAEWSVNKWEVSSDFDLSARQADIVAARVDSQEVRELIVPLSEPGAESTLGRWLQGLLAQPHAA
jgi:hypothetical protein